MLPDTRFIYMFWKFLFRKQSFACFEMSSIDLNPTHLFFQLPLSCLPSLLFWLEIPQATHLYFFPYSHELYWMTLIHNHLLKLQRLMFWNHVNECPMYASAHITFSYKCPDRIHVYVLHIKICAKHASHVEYDLYITRDALNV